ncbi:Aldolase-type TIM barrel [Syntrophomonas zehnderi OL-4]|uniref:Citramalate synthase n=1 Tax=Syntrophomonas zehnderi OL-4 TaxID=690567 RepID=A0A0E3W3I9_9FIRM|nr:Aldolase-type TIM barrel [Syntrophomonas zehnderi OL-4]
MDVLIYDTTLRDGSQGEGISLSVEDKIKIARKLDFLGVSYIEGGWPGSNPKDMAFFQAMRDYPWENAKLSAFSFTRKAGVRVQDDIIMKSLLESGVKVATLVGKSWDFHVLRALETTLEENLSMVGESIAYLKDKGFEVFFDAEHFFDGYKRNPDYALQVLETAAQAGADCLVLCDTNGGCMPWEIAQIINQVRSRSTAPLGIHTHNDSACAVSNSLIAVQNGCVQVQGTINSYGERCGNADLCSIIPNLELKMDLKCLPDGKLKHLTEVSHYVSEIANMPGSNNQPFVGYGAFAHKAGIHVSALLKDSLTYEHINPEAVGNHRRVLVSELAGLSNLQYKAQELGIDINKYSDETKQLTKKIKELENDGYQFEGADASLELLLRKAFNQYEDYFQLKNLKIILEKTVDNEIISEAMIKLAIGSEIVHTAAEGDGPVNALDNSLRKALYDVYPEINEMHLTDYKVRVLNGQEATAAKVRVLIESSDQHEKWTTVGVSENIIEASYQALVDSINYMMMKRQLFAERTKRLEA